MNQALFKKQQQQEAEEASVHDLDEYLADFYEDNMDLKVKSTRKILLLCMDLKNMEYLLNHEQLLGVISRVLREDFKKSTELSLYLLCVFFVFSNYQQFHQVLLQNQVGDATMKIIEYHIDRFNLRYAEFMEISKKHQDYEKELRKLNLMIAKQDKLFYMALTVLLNLAEDFSIEKKMKKRKIVTHLTKLLERNDFHLLIVVLLFVRKLSIISENKDQMYEDGLVPKLARFFTCNNNILLQLALGVMKNIAFDQKMRAAIDKAGFIPKIVEFLTQPNCRFVSIVLLYLLSLDVKIRDSISYTDCMQTVLKLMIHFPERHVGKELISLAVNLGASAKNSELMTEEETKFIIDRAFKNQDITLFKFVKNIVQSADTPEVQKTAKRFMKHFMKMALREQKNDDLKIEVLGIFSSIKLGERWMDFLKEPQFIEYLNYNLSQNVEDDILLETIMVVTHICENQVCCEFLAKKKFLPIMTALLIEKGDDDEFITQTLYGIYQFLYHKIGTEYILNSEDVMVTLLNNIQDKNLEVRKINDELLDILREYDLDFTERVRERKFYEFNKEWVESMEEYERQYIGEYDQHIMDQPYYQDYLEDEEQLDPRMWDSDMEDQ